VALSNHSARSFASFFFFGLFKCLVSYALLHLYLPFDTRRPHFYLIPFSFEVFFRLFVYLGLQIIDLFCILSLFSFSAFPFSFVSPRLYNFPVYFLSSSSSNVEFFPLALSPVRSFHGYPL
jgi:hypothetical protein